jgi:hypothetical protein
MARFLQAIFVFVWIHCRWRLKTDTLPKVLSFSSSPARNRVSEIAQPPIEVEMGGVSYRVEPAFRYALDGMVVSYQVHDVITCCTACGATAQCRGLCVVWATMPAASTARFRFANGEFTCTWHAQRKDWRAFRLDQSRQSSAHGRSGCARGSVRRRQRPVH